MGTKQKFADMLLLFKTQRKYQIIAGAVGVAFLYLYFTGPGTPRAPRETRSHRAAEPVRRSTLANEENTADFVRAFTSNLENVNKSIEEIRKDNVERDKKMTEYTDRTAEILKKMMERIADQEAAGGVMPGEAAAVDGPAPVDIPLEDPTDVSLSAPQQAESLESFGEMNPPEAPPPPPSDPKTIAYVGAGDSVRVKLLAGVRAPTDGTPYPVLFKLIGDVQGPDGSSLPLGEARLIAAAQGSLTDSRVLFRLTKMNIRLPDGRRKVMDIDGWVVGEDGLRGMQGIPIDPIGKSIAAAGMIGGLGALGQGLAQSTESVTQDTFGGTTTVITGDLGTYAAGKGAAGFAAEWGKIVADRTKQLVPVIEVYSGREGTAVFSQSVAVRGLFEAMESEDDVFSPVD